MQLFMPWTRAALWDTINKTNKTADNSQHITANVLPPSWNAFLSPCTQVKELSRCLSGRRTGNLRSGTQANKLDGDYSTPCGPLRGSCWVNAPLWLWTWSEASQAWIDGAGRVRGSDFNVTAVREDLRQQHGSLLSFMWQTNWPRIALLMFNKHKSHGARL